MKKLVISLFAILIFSGFAAAQERPQCYDSEGNFIYKGVGACFIELAGQPNGIAGFTEDGRLIAEWINNNNDWIRGNRVKGTFHLSDAHANLTFIPPSACDQNGQNCDPTKFYHGEGLISLNGPLFFGSCPDTLNIMGKVQSPSSGDWFRAQYMLVLTKSQTEGCKLGFEKLTVTPL